MTFHKRLKETRQSRKTSIRRICSDLKIQKSTYENWEINVYPSRPEFYKKLAEYLDVALEYLMFGERKNTEWERTVSHQDRGGHEGAARAEGVRRRHTTAEIARNAGVTEALIYKDLQDKRYLLHQILGEYLEQYFIQFQNDLRGIKGALSNLRQTAIEHNCPHNMWYSVSR